MALFIPMAIESYNFKEKIYRPQKLYTVVKKSEQELTNHGTLYIKICLVFSNRGMHFERHLTGL